MLFQELRLFEELTAWENVQLKNSLTSYKKRSEIRQWFEELGIADKWDRKVGQMSFGQQQRVAFIRSLCQPFRLYFSGRTDQSPGRRERTLHGPYSDRRSRQTGSRNHCNLHRETSGTGV